MLYLNICCGVLQTAPGAAMPAGYSTGIQGRVTLGSITGVCARARGPSVPPPGSPGVAGSRPQCCSSRVLRKPR